MSEELDPHKLIVDFVNSNIDRLADSVSSAMKGTKNVIRARLASTYRAYLKRVLDRHSRAKSFFVRSEPLPIYEFFVPPNISSQQRVLKAPGAAELAAVAPAAIVSGSGGCGKTMFMRHLLVSNLVQQHKMPVLLELRQLNAGRTKVRTALLDTLNSNGLRADDEYFELALEAGHFCLLLDGFDELELGIRARIAKEIQHLAEKYPQNWIFLSSRPDSNLEGWQGFSLFSVEPLDLSQSIELVEKLPFDDPIKAKFIEALRSGLYKEHESFLSNPLLLSIMLLTYSDIAHIPSKLSIFYNQAYESLFQKHDALKGGFQRKRRTPLDIQDFATAFAAFCVQTYDRREFSFSRTKALEYFDQAKAISGLDFDSEGILDDTVQAVCLMIEDGLEITFAHRSFQEYFVARFITSIPPAAKEKLIRRFTKSVEPDSVMQLLFELDPYAVESHYLLPMIEKLQKHIQFKGRIGVTHHLRYIQAMYGSFEIADRGSGAPELRLVALISNSALFDAVRFALVNYDAEVSTSPQSDYENLQRVFIKEYGENALVETKSLRTNSPFLRALAKYGGKTLWGTENLRRVIQIGKLIRKRHDEAESSLEAILK